MKVKTKVTKWDIIIELIKVLGSSGIVIGFFSFLNKIQDNKSKVLLNSKNNEQIILENIKKITKINHIIQEGLKISGINRIIILQAHNSGGIPSPTNPMYLTCLNEATDSKTGSMLYNIQKTPLDDEHTTMLRDLLTNDSITLVQRDLGEKMRILYEAYNHRFSKVYLLEVTSVYFIYIAFCFDNTIERPENLTAETQVQLLNTVNQIKSIYKEK